MKKYKQILEAVNRGIKFALDDFEDQEDIQGQTNSKVKYNGGIKEYIEPFVDLGLPSGTLWCKCNLGAENEYDYGDYYAWGELTAKNEYTKENYIYKDKHIQLLPEHDVATKILGENYSIPTKELCEELIKYTDNRWVENYDGTGVNGTLFISKINSNSIFIPAAGYYVSPSLYVSSRLYYEGSIGHIWSSSLYTEYPNNAWQMFFSDKYTNMSNYSRYYGLSVRPIINL